MRVYVRSMKTSFFIVAFCVCAACVSAADLVLKVTEPYLNLPVSQQADRKQMTCGVKNEKDRSFVIRLSANPEYWVFADVSQYMNRRLKISFDGDSMALNKVYLSSEPAGSDNMYSEENRPQLHYTTRRGWVNDPNGLIYYDGEYHLFYQHNPYEREWENMHWGHAVSRDLLHWTELPTALYPDEHGTAFSGTAVMDYENTSGFGSKRQPAMVAIYTANSPERQVQCLAYSLDKGRTWKKYEGNPVLDTKEHWNSHDTRDPKVFWHEPSGKWVMVLNERDGHSIYNSENLKDWTYESHVVGFWECPELFELPVDGNPENTLWVMYGASGTYMLGHFDGRQFTPVTGKLAYCFGALYAAQTYNNMPLSDGRRIQIAWDRVEQPGMPFKGQMSVPMELSLRTVPDGIRLFCNPIKEFDRLQAEKLVAAENISAEEANRLLNQYKDAGTLRIKATVQFSHSTPIGLSLYGQNIIDYDLNFNRVNGFHYSQTDFSDKLVSADIIIDRTTIQVFFDGGGLSYCLQREPQTGNTQGFSFWGHQTIEVKGLEVYSMYSIWK